MLLLLVSLLRLLYTPLPPPAPAPAAAHPPPPPPPPTLLLYNSPTPTLRSSPAPPTARATDTATATYYIVPSYYSAYKQQATVRALTRASEATSVTLKIVCRFKLHVEADTSEPAGARHALLARNLPLPT